MKRKKVVLVANTSWYLYNFKGTLINELINKNYKIYVVSPNDKYSIFLQNKINFINWNLNRKSLNPFSAFCSIYELIGILKLIKPDLVHLFTIKSCIYGSIAAKLLGTKNILNAFTGMAPFNYFLHNQLVPVKFIFIFIIKKFFCRDKVVNIFQNKDDLINFNALFRCQSNKSIIIPGSGVDTNFFNSEDLESSTDRKKKILFPARLIKEKGIIELIEASLLLWNEGFNFELYLAGILDKGNSSCLTREYLAKIENNKNIICLGHVHNMRDLYQKTDIVVLPSWREGLSRSLIEAASMKCPIITTDVPGCRDVIDHEFNGLLVPAKDITSLKLAMKFLLLNPQIGNEFGRKAREKVLLNFKISRINDLTIKVYEDLLN